MRKRLIFFAGLVLVLFVCLMGVLYATHKSQTATPPLSSKQMLATITTDKLFGAINEARAANNLPSFNLNPTLNTSSRLKCDDMVANDYYEHARPSDAKRGVSYIKDVGQTYEQASENLNLGQFTSAEDVVSSWMNSAPHRASILDPNYTEIGFATCIIPSTPDLMAVVQHKIQPDVPSFSQASHSTSATTSQALAKATCNEAAKAEQVMGYNRSKQQIQVLYELEMTDPILSKSAAVVRDSKLASAEFNFKMNLYKINCTI